MSDHLTIVDHPLVQHKLSIMRQESTSTAAFRQLLREISQLLAYEVTRALPMTSRVIRTPIQEMETHCLAGKKMALISILRAGNGLLDGILDLVPSARVGFVGLFRNEETLEPVQYYYKVPDHLDERMVIAVDPMLPLQSVAAIDSLNRTARTSILCLLVAQGVSRMKEAHPDAPIVMQLWIVTSMNMDTLCQDLEMREIECLEHTLRNIVLVQ